MSAPEDEVRQAFADDPILRDVLHPARRQPRISLEPCPDTDELDLVIGDGRLRHRHCMTAADLDALRDVLGLPSGRERPLAALRFLAALHPAVLDEAILVWKHESPDKAARLYDLLTGRAEPAWKDERP